MSLVPKDSVNLNVWKAFKTNNAEVDDRMQMLDCNVQVQIIHLNKMVCLCRTCFAWISSQRSGLWLWQTHSVNDKYHSEVARPIFFYLFFGEFNHRQMLRHFAAGFTGRITYSLSVKHHALQFQWGFGVGIPWFIFCRYKALFVLQKLLFYLCVVHAKSLFPSPKKTTKW